MRQRIDAGPLIAAAGALLLLVSLFLDWYEPGISAWTVFEVLDLLLALLALATLAVAARSLLPSPLPERRPRELVPIALAALLVVVSQIVQHPPAAVGRALEEGAWLALGGALLMTLGALLTIARVSLAVDVEPRGATPPVDAPAGAPEPTSPEPRPAEEAAGAEPLVQDELYPPTARSGPIGADDSEPWTAPDADETVPLEEDPPPGRT